jgi:O-acetyl-ADP-ribose deacetylase (regulator of RNase III)
MKEDLKEKNIMELNYIKGDLFTAKSVLAHCISSDFALGAGIAKAFAEKGVKSELMHRYEKNKWNGHGYCLVTNINSMKVYNLVTKQSYWMKPSYYTLKEALQSMKNQMIETEIAMPLIGCGLDRLQWSEVKKLIKDVFDNTNINITIYQL